MSLYLITGMPGAGKTTVCNELRVRGYTAYDGDKDHLAQWFSNKTGQPVPETGQHPPEFLRNHHRSIARKTVEKLAEEAQSKPVFLCNDPENEAEVLDLFTKAFALILDKSTLRERIFNRVGSGEWGRLPHELEYSMSFWDKTQAAYHGPNYITIDATKPTSEIVDAILEVIKE